MKTNGKGICIRVVATLLAAVLVMSLCPVIPSASAAGETYTLTFDTSELLLWPSWLKSPMVVNAGEKVQIPSATMNDASFYVFLSWKDENGEEYYPGDMITPDHDMNFTANTKFTVNCYQVTYSAGAVGGSGTQFRRAYDKNNEKELEIPGCPEGFKPSDGYIFDGWEVTSDAIGYSASFGLGDIGQTIVTSGKDYKMTAKWKEDIPTDYKITYHFNDPSAEDISAGSFVLHSDGYQVTIKGLDEALHNSSKFHDGDRVKGCVFVGWSTMPDGTADPTYDVGDTVTLLGDLDLYAVWEERSFNYTVNYHFKDSFEGEDVEVKNVTGTAGLDEPIPYDKEDKTGSNGKAYAFDSVGEEKVVTQVEGDNVIDVYYYLDTLSDELESQNDSDKIPDIYQKVITYKVNNGTWDGEVLDQINEIVTLRDEDGALSRTGTATLEKVPDERTAHGDLGMTHYLWDTPDDARPTTVSYNDSGVYILDFFDAENALIIYPQPVVVDYDGNWHTFEKFVVHDYQGNERSDVTVTWKEGVEKPDRAGRRDGTPESGDEVNLETVLNNAGTGGWRRYFTISSLADVGKMHTILEGGTITINPRPVTVELKITDTGNLTPGVDGAKGDETVQPSAFKYDEAEEELVVEYVFDGYTHTVELGSEYYQIDGLIEGDKDKVKLSPNEGGDVILSATNVVDPGEEPTIDLTEALTFYQGDEPTSSYVVKGADGGGAAGIMTTAIAPLADGEEEVTGSLADKTIHKITVRIVPRPATYWTFGAARIFDGNGIPSDASYTTPWMNNGTQDPEKKDKYHFIIWPKYQAINRGDGGPIRPDERGFVVRSVTPGSNYTPLNHYPSGDSVDSPWKAGITNCREGIEGFMDGIDHTKDYAIDYKLGYFTVYPQSITDDPDETYHDVTTYIYDQATNYDGYVAAYDEHVVEYTYLDREKGTAPSTAELPAFYTGVKLTDGPEASYPAPYKFEGGVLRNENNAIEYQTLVEGTDYTVTYQRKNAAGEWKDTEDFSTPGTIQVTYTGIGNYRNRLTREYDLVPTEFAVTVTVNKDNAGLAGQTVYLENGGVWTAMSAGTNDGEYTANMAPGTYNIYTGVCPGTDGPAEHQTLSSTGKQLTFAEGDDVSHPENLTAEVNYYTVDLKTEPDGLAVSHGTDAGAGTTSAVFLAGATAQNITAAASGKVGDNNYTFQNWTVGAGFTGVKVEGKNSATFTLPAEADLTENTAITPATPITITAKYVYVPNAYIVTYEVGKNTAATVKAGESPVNVTEGQDNVAVKAGTILENVGAGWNFTGWQDASGTPYAAGATLPAITGNVTLTAQWTVDVTFDSNAPEGTAVADPAKQTPVPGGTLSTLPTPELNGYTFAGWYTAPTGGTQAKAGDVVNAPVTYYAHWTKEQSTVVYDWNYEGKPTNVEHKGAPGAEDTEALTTPTRPGYTFAGWYTTADCATAAPDPIVFPANGTSVTYYAKWTEEQSTVVYDWNYEGKPTDVTHTGAPGAEDTTPTPTRSGYTFAGWYTEDTCKDENKAPDPIVFPADGETVTYYAKWTANRGSSGGRRRDDCKVTYLLGLYGSTPNGTTETVRYNAKPQAVPSVTAQSGYQFLGWSRTGPTGDIATDAARTLVDPTTVSITSDTTFYAVYQLVQAQPAKPDHSSYVIGYPDGTFGPGDNIDRASVATIIARAVLPDFQEGSDYGNPGNYSDVDGHWAASAIAYCSKYGVFTGYADGTFRPSQSISRQELALVIARLDGVLTGDAVPFSDGDQIGDWAKDGVYTAYTKGWVSGYPDGTFKPQNPIRRDEAVKVFNAFLGRGVDAAGLSGLTEYVHTGAASNNQENGSTEYMTWSDVPKDQWAYYEIIEAANDHTCDATKTSLPEKWLRCWIDERWNYHDN